MVRLVVVCMALMAVGCGNDHLADRVTGLEQQVADLQAQQAEAQQSLLARLDEVRVTPENAPEVAEIRTKLAQTGITQDDLIKLQARVQRLEQQALDWSVPVAQVRGSVYAVLQGVYPANDKSQMKVAFLGTAFAASSQTLVTNGHMVDGLLHMDQLTTEYNTRHGTNLQSVWMVIQDQTVTLRYKQNSFNIGRHATHPDWNAQDPASADVGLLMVSEGYLPRWVNLATTSAARTIKVGQPIGTLGFPGELQGDAVDDTHPIATFKDGTVSALRPQYADKFRTAANTYLVQHDLNLSGGTSGSPIFTSAGVVVAVNSSGIEALVPTSGGDSTRVSQAALGFGIRADKIQELLATQPAAKATGGGTDAWQWLDGRRLGDLGVCTARDLEQQLER
jgi:V8-like Glu-specific endopeptidase